MQVSSIPVRSWEHHDKPEMLTLPPLPPGGYLPSALLTGLSGSRSLSLGLSWIIIQQEIKHCLLLVIFSLHISKFPIRFQRCAFSLQNSEHLSSHGRGFTPHLLIEFQDIALQTWPLFGCEMSPKSVLFLVPCGSHTATLFGIADKYQFQGTHRWTVTLHC